MKRLFAVILTLALTIGITGPVQASLNPAGSSDVRTVSHQLAKAIEIIMTHYLRPVTINELYEAAAHGMAVKTNQRNYYTGASAVTVGPTFPVQVARGLSISDEAQIAGDSLAKSIELIMTQYPGVNVTAAELMDAALRGMAEILDSYSIYMSASEYEYFMGVMSGKIPGLGSAASGKTPEPLNIMSGKIPGLGVVMTTNENGRSKVYHVLPDSPAQAAGIRSGDIFLFVNWQYATDLSWGALTTQLLSPDNEFANIIVKREDSFYVFNIPGEEMYSPTVVVKQLQYIPEAQRFSGLSGVKYMHISGIGATTGDDVQRAVNKMQPEGYRKLILNLRGNTGGYLNVTVDIGNLLIPEGTILETMDKSGQRYTYTSTLQNPPFEYIVVLVDHYTASGAEVIASALQDSGIAVVIGETTYGKGLVQSIYELGTDGALKITTKEYFRRSGGIINQIGVIPCIEVRELQIYGGLDAVMYRALELLSGK